jgi:hypothetical protein
MIDTQPDTQPSHAWRETCDTGDADLRRARAACEALTDATLAALLGLRYDADEYDELVLAHRRALRAVQQTRRSAAA